MATVFVVEDNVFQREMMLQYIEEVVAERGYGFQLDHETWQPRDVLKELGYISTPNIYFLDIDLQLDQNGIDLGRELRSVDLNGYIIFVTSHADKIKEVIDQYISPFAYIVKSVTDSDAIKDDIAEVLAKIKEKENMIHQHNTFHVELPTGAIELPLKDIIYFETVPRSKKTDLRVLNGRYTINKYLKTIKESLEDTKGFISFKSYLINLENVVSVNKEEGFILFKDNYTLYVGQRIITKFYEAFKAYRS
ncbi:LytR/AlgR family response regulator transcription factor [Listeria booriae]|uniref:LytR/AlgR family response regulator transcription factor n=1 Tax=Listeria booriae TaxID=1552123 RepID=UPI001628B87E|nr:LytTR family DNA-binding domain-containing protein [Listeria booriae]MBC2326997.1 response regulator transcription factor [Listeria booriae]